MACFSFIDICGVQINRLDQAGNVLNGAEDVVLSCSMQQMQISANRADDRNSESLNGRGAACVRRTRRGEVTNWTINATFCARVDAAEMELLGVGERVLDENGLCKGFELSLIHI